MSDGNNGDSGRDDRGRFTFGNPGGPGRHPKESSLTDILERELADFKVIGRDGKEARGPELLARKLIRAAFADMATNPVPGISAETSLRAAALIYDRVDGKPVETLRHEGGSRRINIGFVPMGAEELDAMDIVEHHQGRIGSDGDGQGIDGLPAPDGNGAGGNGK